MARVKEKRERLISFLDRRAFDEPQPGWIKVELVPGL